jgi:hypothetical protein
MGNASVRELTVHHPTSLSCVCNVQGGKIVSSSAGHFHLQKTAGAATGCGGAFTFKHDVLEAEYIFTVKHKFSSNVEVGQTFRSRGRDEEEAALDLSWKLNIGVEHILEHTTHRKIRVTDKKPIYSIANFYTSYSGANTFEWIKNDLNLKYEIIDGDDYGRSVEHSFHPVITVSFEND